MTGAYPFAQTDNDRARRIEQFMPLVRRVARRIVRRLPAVVDLADLEQVGVIGLIDAIDRYDASRSERFDAYAEYRIKGAILDDLRKKDHLSRRHRGRINSLRQAQDQLKAELGREADAAELAKALSISPAEVEDLRAEANSSWLVYDETGGDDERSRSGGAILASLNTTSDIHEEVASRQAQGMLAESIGHLPERLQLLLALYYQEDLTYREIAEVLGVTVGRVSQLHSEATRKLRGMLERRMGVA
ncbi:MAG: RNA polymerase sigma factor FliA [Myxococcales bacterium]|nr:RNA polymerase sigma factor FliA [Myxococcales bacterium]|tara:strand:+ start:1126 stop:1866 length:741 start_codon:yes stop_codon:yes gene_type:complete